MPTLCCVYLSKIVTLYIITTRVWLVYLLFLLCISFKNCNFVHHNNHTAFLAETRNVVYIFQKL